MSKLSRFLEIVKVMAPIALGLVNPALIPISSIVTEAIAKAEQIPGATGVQKAQHVKEITMSAVKAINVAKPETLNETAIEQSLQDGIDTVISTTKVFKH